MEIERVARKLAPLIPDQVQHWLRVRDLADPGLRELIDQQIITEAHRRLGDFRQKILLSLPPEKLAHGSIELGTVLYDGEKWPAGISTGELLQGLSIFGRSGAGKTNVAFHLLRQLSERRIPWLFLDWKRTGRHALALFRGQVNVYTPGRSLAPMVFNPFIPPPGLEPEVYATQCIDALADAYTLGDGAHSLLQRVLIGCYRVGNLAPTATDLLSELEKLPLSSRARLWKVSATRALESLVLSGMASADPLSQEQLAARLLQENTILELDALGQNVKRFVIPLLSFWLYSVRLGSPAREKLKLVIFIEEAHHLLYGHERRSKEALMAMLLRQCREVGIGMVVIDQHPHLISSAAIGNTYTSLCLNLKDPRDIRRAAEISLVPADERNLFSKLPVGHAICKLQDRWREPFLVRLPLVSLAKGSVTDSVLRNYLREVNAGSTGRHALGVDSGHVPRIPRLDRALDDVELRFIKDVRAFPDDGVKTRYHRLGIGGGRGTRIRRQLVEDGWLQAAIVTVGRTRKLVLGHTPEARSILGVEPASNGRASLVHEFWKRYYAKRYTDLGYKVEAEAPFAGGRVDLVATKHGERIAIEIETGKSDVVANVKRCLRAGFGRVIVVATDEAAIAKVEQELAKAGLIIPGRITILPRGSGQVSIASSV